MVTTVAARVTKKVGPKTTSGEDGSKTAAPCRKDLVKRAREAEPDARAARPRRRDALSRRAGFYFWGSSRKRSSQKKRKEPTNILAIVVYAQRAGGPHSTVGALSSGKVLLRKREVDGGDGRTHAPRRPTHTHTPTTPTRRLYMDSTDMDMETAWSDTPTQRDSNYPLSARRTCGRVF